MGDELRCAANWLYRFGIDWEVVSPRSDDERYLYSLIKNSGDILADHKLLPDYRSLRSHAEWLFAKSDHSNCYRAYEPVAGAGDQASPPEVFRKLRQAFVECASFVFWDYEEGLPLYLEEQNKFTELNGCDVEAEYLDLFSGRFWEDEYFQTEGLLTTRMVPVLDALHYSDHELRMKQVFFSQYERSGSRELEIRQRAYRLMLAGKLFDESPSLESHPKSFVLDTRAEDGLLMTIGLLAKSLAAKSGNRFTNGSKISASALATSLLQDLPKIRGLGETSVRKRISDGIAKLDEQLPETN